MGASFSNVSAKTNQISSCSHSISCYTLCNGSDIQGKQSENDWMFRKKKKNSVKERLKGQNIGTMQGKRLLCYHF